MADSTGQYSHEVLIGNWNEDAFGKQHAANSGIPVTQDSFTSTQQADYKQVPGEALNDAAASRIHSQGRTELSADLLFTHKGADPTEERYTTTYNATWKDSSGSVPEDPPKRSALLEKKKKEWAKEQDHGSRSRTYATENNLAYTEANSARAQPADLTHLRKGVMEKTFDAPFRNLHLRNS